MVAGCAEFQVKPRTTSKGDNINFWAALDRNGVVLGSGSHADAVTAAAKKGVENPVLWRVVEAYQHEELGFTVTASTEDGKLSVGLKQECPKCKKSLAPLSSRCDECGHIILLDRFLQGE